MKDLTKGRPEKLLLSFSLPIFFGNLLQLTYSLVDTRIVGSYLGKHALAAVGATSTMSGLLIGFLMGLANGFAIIQAQCFGAKDMRRLRKSLAASFVLGGGITLVLTVLGLVFLNPILRFLNISEQLMRTAREYIFIIMAGMIVTLLYDVCAAVMRAIGDTITPLIILAISVVLNIVGDMFFYLCVKDRSARSSNRYSIGAVNSIDSMHNFHAKEIRYTSFAPRRFCIHGKKYDWRNVKFRSIHGLYEFPGKYRFSFLADSNQ